jgi:general secretion pathway protein G
MERATPIGNQARWRRGFSLIELLIVLTVVSILISIAVPLYHRAVLRSRETVLKNNLFTLRTMIDEYTYDKAKAPQDLRDLVEAGYLRAIPRDPMTGSDQTWRVEMEDSLSSVNQTEPGIFDVKSGSELKALDGTPYAEW